MYQLLGVVNDTAIIKKYLKKKKSLDNDRGMKIIYPHRLEFCLKFPEAYPVSTDSLRRTECHIMKIWT